MTEYSAVIVVQSNEAGQPTNLLALGDQDTLAKGVLPPDIQSLPGDVTAISDSTGALQPLLPITGDLLGLEGDLTAINAATGTLSPLLPITGTLTALDGIVTGPGGVLDDIDDLYAATGSIADATGSLDPLTSVLPLTGPGIVDGLLDLEGDVTALQEATGLNYFSITGLTDATGGLEGDVTALYLATGLIVDATGPLDTLANAGDVVKLEGLVTRSDDLANIAQDYDDAGGDGTLFQDLNATATQLGPLTGITSETGGLVHIHDDYNTARGGGPLTVLADLKDGVEATGVLTGVLPLTGPGIVDDLLDATANINTLFDQTGLNYNDITGIAEATGTLDPLTSVLPLTGPGIVDELLDATANINTLFDQTGLNFHDITGINETTGTLTDILVDGSSVLSGLSSTLVGNNNGPDVAVYSALSALANRLRVVDTITAEDSPDGQTIYLSGASRITTRAGTTVTDLTYGAGNQEIAVLKLQNSLGGVAYLSGTGGAGLMAPPDGDIWMSFEAQGTGTVTSSLRDLFVKTSDSSGNWNASYDYVDSASGDIRDTSNALFSVTGLKSVLDVTSESGAYGLNVTAAEVNFVDPAGAAALSGVRLIRSRPSIDLVIRGDSDADLVLNNVGDGELRIGKQGVETAFVTNDFKASADNWSEVYDAYEAGDIGGGGATSIASAIHYNSTTDIPIVSDGTGLPVNNAVLRYNNTVTAFEFRKGQLGEPFTYDGTSLEIEPGPITFNLGDVNIGGGNSLDFSASFTTSGNTKSLLEFDDKSRVALGRNSVPLEISANGEADVRLEDDGTDGAFVLIKGTKAEDSPSISQVHLQSADLSADATSEAIFDSPIATNNTIEANGGKGSSHPTAGGQVLQSRGSSTAVTWGNKKKLRWYESDFHSADVRINGPWLGAAINSGTTGGGPVAALYTEMMGAVLLRSSTTADSGYRWDSQAMDRIAPRKNLFFECIFAIPDDFTNKTAKLGFYDDVTNATAAVDGTYFLIDNSGNITPETANNSTRTTGATYALSVDTVYKAQIWWSTSTTAIFKLTNMDESTVHQTWTISTNLPSGTARRFGAGAIAKSSGTAVDDLFVLDYMGWGLYPYREDDSL